MYDRVVYVLGHGDTRPELRAVLCDKLSCRGVLVFQIARVSLATELDEMPGTIQVPATHNGGKKPMEWKELKSGRFNVRF
jgi:hypothetical protein